MNVCWSNILAVIFTLCNEKTDRDMFNYVCMHNHMFFFMYFTILVFEAIDRKQLLYTQKLISIYFIFVCFKLGNY